MESWTKSQGFRPVTVLFPRRDETDPEPGYAEKRAGANGGTHAIIRLDSLTARAFDLRSAARHVMNLPILIVIGGTQHTAVIRNLSYTGALIGTSAPLNVDMRIEFQCGSICASGAVIWYLQGKFGIKFDRAICERQLDEQLLRSNAIAARSCDAG